MRNLRTSRWLGLIIMLIVALPVIVACTSDGEGIDKSRQAAVHERERNFQEAEAKFPAPDPNNFPLREALVKFTERQDQINHPWYIYIMGMDGTYLGYFVGQTYPINSCNFLSSSERIHDRGSNEDFVLTAPSYDGMFYGGGGSSAACNSMFFFDVETDAMLTFSTPLWFASDVPLDLDVPRLSSTAPDDE